MSEKSTDYREYRLSLKERLVFGLLFLVASAVAFWLLFGIVWVGLPAGLALLPLFWKKLSESLCRRRHRILEEEFCTYMQLTAAALASGTSFDNVFREVADTKPLAGKAKYMDTEFLIISRLISLNYESTEAFALFAERTGSTDIKSMADALSGMAYSGGNLVTLVRGGVESLRLKQDTEREIKRILSAPRMNQRILTFMPFAFIFLLKMKSPEYVNKLYSGVGIIVMAAVTLLLIASFFAGEKITNIKF